MLMFCSCFCCCGYDQGRRATVSCYKEWQFDGDYRGLDASKRFGDRLLALAVWKKWTLVAKIWLGSKGKVKFIKISSSSRFFFFFFFLRRSRSRSHWPRWRTWISICRAWVVWAEHGTVSEWEDGARLKDLGSCYFWDFFVSGLCVVCLPFFEHVLDAFKVQLHHLILMFWCWVDVDCFCLHYELHNQGPKKVLPPLCSVHIYF